MLAYNGLLIAQPGALDPTFPASLPPRHEVAGFALEKDGNVLVATDSIGIPPPGFRHVLRYKSSGSPDSSFDSASAPIERIFSIRSAPDGKSVIAGILTNGILTNGIARLNRDGTLDAGFIPKSPFGPRIGAFAVQRDGKVLITGSAIKDGQLKTGIVRLNSDGSLDSEFRPGAGPNYTVAVVALQDDDKILLGGQFTWVDEQPRFGVARLNANGSLDTNFAADPPLNENSDYPIIHTITTQADGKVLIGGEFSMVGGARRMNLARLTSGGRLDTTFDPGMVDSSVGFIGVQGNGKVIITGGFGSIDGIPRRHVARLNANGSLDHGFVVPGHLRVGHAALQVDGKVIIGEPSPSLIRLQGGEYPPSPAAIVDEPANQTRRVGQNAAWRATARSHVPLTFQWQFNGLKIPGATNAVLEFIDLQAAHMGSYSVTVSNPFGAVVSRPAHLVVNPAPLTAGSVDLSFRTGAGPNGTVRAIVMQQDDRAIIGGDFTAFNGAPAGRIARVAGDGSLDNTFNSTQGADGRVFCLALRPDGKILAGGMFSHFNGVPCNGIARLNHDGTFDPDFRPDPELNGSVWTAALQPDGRILLGRGIDISPGQTRPALTRMNPNGTSDETFNAPFPGATWIQSIALQSDGKIVVAAHFGTGSAGTSHALVRLDPDGSPDASFHSPTGSIDLVHSLTVLDGDQIQLAGSFSIMGAPGVRRNLIARLHSDGAIDESFDAQLHYSRQTTSLGFAVESKGLLVFDDLLRRLSSNGSVDRHLWARADGPIFCLAIQKNGHLLIGGAFSTVSQMPRARLARIYAGDHTPVPKLYGPFHVAQHSRPPEPAPPAASSIERAADSRGPSSTASAVVALAYRLRPRNTFELALPTLSGKTYFLEFKNQLDDPDWSVLAAVLGDGSAKRFLDTTADSPQRFYRIRVENQ